MIYVLTAPWSTSEMSISYTTLHRLHHGISDVLFFLLLRLLSNFHAFFFPSHIFQVLDLSCSIFSGTHSFEGTQFSAGLRIWRLTWRSSTPMESFPTTNCYKTMALSWILGRKSMDKSQNPYLCGVELLTLTRNEMWNWIATEHLSDRLRFFSVEW